MRILTLLLLAAVATADGPKRAGYLGARLGARANREAGVVLQQVFPKTPAADAGLQQGDIVVRIGKEAVANPAELGAQLRAHGAGTQVDVVVIRGGEEKTIAVKLGVHPRVLLEEPDKSPGMLPVKVTRDLSYHLETSGLPKHARHMANIMEPVGEGDFPVILWIHAGAWTYGDRSRETALGMRFAERGFVFAAISYRLSSRRWRDKNASAEGVKHPAHTEDCAMAFAWLKKRYPGRKVSVAGHSCGAHIAALMATDARYLKKYGLERNAIKGVVAIGGAYDMVAYHGTLAGGPMGKSGADAHLIWILGDGPEQWKHASPTTYLEQETVPMLIVSDGRTHVYLEQFRKIVDDAGIKTIRFRRAEDRTHGQSTPFMSRKQSDPIRDEMIAFLQKQ